MVATNVPPHEGPEPAPYNTRTLFAAHFVS